MLNEKKKQVIEMAQQSEKWGLCKHKAGNSSVRDVDTGYILITPTGVDKKLLTTRDIVVMDLDANVIEAESGLKPTSECLMHFEIYKVRPDINAICHTHSIFATSFAVLAKPIPAVIYECVILDLKKAVIPVAPYARPGTTDLPKNIREAIQQANGILLEKHGVVAVAKDPYDAVLNAAYIEEMAQIYYQTLVINGGKEPDSFQVDELQKWQYPKEIKFNNH